MFVHKFHSVAMMSNSHLIKIHLFKLLWQLQIIIMHISINDNDQMSIRKVSIFQLICFRSNAMINIKLSI
jgi:hypothetical protein